MVTTTPGDSDQHVPSKLQPETTLSSQGISELSNTVDPAAGRVIYLNPLWNKPEDFMNSLMKHQGLSFSWSTMIEGVPQQVNITIFVEGVRASYGDLGEQYLPKFSRDVVYPNLNMTALIGSSYPRHAQARLRLFARVDENNRIVELQLQVMEGDYTLPIMA